MTLSYSELLELLASMNRIAPESEGAFKARLRHFQRLGFPKGSNTGKGRRAEYDLDMVLQLALAIQFMQAGVTPQHTVSLITKNWSETRTYFLFAAAPGPLKAENGAVLSNELALCVSPEALRELTTDGESEVDHFEAFNFIEVDKLPEFLKDNPEQPVLGDFYRWIVILLRPLVAVLMLSIEDLFKIDAASSFVELQRIVRKHHEDLEALSKEIEAVVIEMQEARERGDGNP
ncbi:hypothetical protein [Caenibius sp. WL]|uniref:hypothetical protein n=1 Tax=Caenibius sp. WL TaxID=2872646 RepID=UPI001C99B279|nr:hypothetical protein [Caenibius sp. WL]QZP08186.1 hypothetical protein K5X80_16395 [Caenibius sp. WL]